MKSINLQRTESLLMELIPEALSELSDSRINSLPITAVNCKNGKYDAIVYFDGSDYDKTEIKEIIASLNTANGRLKTHTVIVRAAHRRLRQRPRTKPNRLRGIVKSV